MGRFIQEDPIGTKDDTNLYRYVANNPMKYTDRFGLEKVLIITGKIANSNDQEELFKLTSQYLYIKELKNGASKNNLVTISDVMTPDQFNKAVNPYLGNIKKIIYIAHGDSGLEAGGIGANNVNYLNTLKIDTNDNPSMLLISCQAGLGWLNSITQKMSNQLDINVQASNTNVSSNIYPIDLEGDNFQHSYGEPYPAGNGQWHYFKPQL